MKRRIKKIMGYLLLILFLGYYGSITLFTHTHIVNGVIIVHSHPFSSGNQKNPISHQHTANSFTLIQFLSHFFATALFLLFSIEVYKEVLKKCVLQKNGENYSNLSFLCSNGLRAPPLNIFN